MDEKDLSRINAFRQLKKEIRGSKEHLIVGIDIGKINHHAFLGTATGHKLRSIVVENSANGFEHLLTMVQFFSDRENLKKIVFGVEPTSVYHKPLSEFLIENGFLLVYAANEAITKNRALLDGRWDKNDNKDAANVADLISQGKCQYYDFPNMNLRDIRSLLLLRKRLKKQAHSARIRIRNNLVAQYFPELDKFWNKNERENLAIVRWCLSPHEINKLELEKFYTMVAPRYRGQTQYRRISKIWEMSPYSIGCRAGQALDLEARILVEGLNRVRSEIIEVEEAIEVMCSCFDEYKLLLTIPGFGPYISSVVLAAIGHPDRFQNAKQVIRLAGYDLNAKRSGKKSNSAVPVISKKGKADLRYALYQAAMIASSSNTYFRSYFHKLLEGREREKGIRTKMRVKLAAKLLIVAWTLMKKKEPFDPRYIRLKTKKA
ncbi:MAG: IS110 family transposase [PVC group bacterium]|nr:IS110 family transposase [PVC group bacterium]